MSALHFASRMALLVCRVTCNMLPWIPHHQVGEADDWVRISPSLLLHPVVSPSLEKHFFFFCIVTLGSLSPNFFSVSLERYLESTRDWSLRVLCEHQGCCPLVPWSFTEPKLCILLSKRTTISLETEDRTQ